MKALIVDDSRAMRTILRRILADLGYQAVEAGHGAEALARLDETEVDLMLVDWNMPEMNGLEFVRAARKLPHIAHVPVVMVTTESTSSYVDAAREAGANGYVTKPFSRVDLQLALDDLGIRRAASP